MLNDKRTIVTRCAGGTIVRQAGIYKALLGEGSRDCENSVSAWGQMRGRSATRGRTNE